MKNPFLLKRWNLKLDKGGVSEMPTLFPKDYEKAMIVKKRKLVKNFKKDNEVTALDIALHAHKIYDYLKQQGVERPNGTFVEAFQYASVALGVPYDVIDEAFLTQTPLTEKELFDFSQTFNPNVKPVVKKDLPLVPITIDFYKIVQSLFEELPISFWEKFRKKEALLSQKDKEAYDLEILFQAFLQEVWFKTKEGLVDQKETTIEKTRQMFLAYFYRNDQKYYRRETQEMLLKCLENCLEFHSENSFKENEELKVLLEEGNSEKVAQYVLTHLTDWMNEKNYKRFLRSITKTKNLSLMNQLLLLYQRSEVLETKEVHDWIRENRSLKKEAKPIFLFGENNYSVDSDSGEILQRKRTALQNHEQLPLVPYFEKTDTEGRGVLTRVEKSTTQLFVIIDKMCEREIVFESIEKATFDEYKIRLKSNLNETQTLQDLFVCFVQIEKEEVDSLIRFENQSVASVLLLFFGLEPLPMDFEILENLRTLEQGKVMIQSLLTNVQFRSESFLETFDTHLTEKEVIKIRPTLEEEIQKAKELQIQAMANIATDKENKANKKNKASVPFSMEEYLEKVKEKAEGNSDDGSNQETSS